MGRGLLLSLAGVLIGLAVALAATRLLESYLFEVSATDSATFLAAGFLVTAVSALASGLPAWRTTQIDPVKVLRAE
jgi:ABC-type lipoprotein release transport system permease subunit